MKKIYTYAILTLVLSALIYVVVHNVEIVDSSYEQTEVALQDIQTGELTSIDFTEKPTVLVLFTSWCPYCNEDAPKLVKLYDKYKDRVNVYGINLTYRDDLDEAKAYIHSHKITYPVLLDETGNVHNQYGKTGFPALFFFNSKGQFIDRIIGSTDYNSIESAFITFQKKFNSYY